MRDTVYIIGGGSSLKGYDFSALGNKDTITVNMSALDVPNPNYCITADSSIYRRLEDGEFSNVDTTWVLVTNSNHCTLQMQRNGTFINIKSQYVHNLLVPNIVIRNAGVEGIGFEFKDFRTGYNSGFCGFQLAVLLGYKYIHLLGFDMQDGPLDRICHYHNRYNRRISKKDFYKYLKNFILALNAVEKIGVKVVSRSRFSLLNDHIEYIDLDCLLAKKL